MNSYDASDNLFRQQMFGNRDDLMHALRAELDDKQVHRIEIIPGPNRHDRRADRKAKTRKGKEARKKR